VKSSIGRKLIGIALLLLGGLYFGDKFFLQKRGVASFEGQVSTSMGTNYYDLTELTGPDFQRAFKKALLQGLQVHHENGLVGMSWGNFLVKNNSGGKVSVCDKYPNIEVTLKAEGVAYSGNVPELTIRGPCLVSDDGQKILPHLIPLQGLYENVRNNPVYKIAIGTRGDSFVVSAQFLYTEWPQYWNVVGVKLYNDAEALSMEGYEIISVLDQPLTLDFAEDQ
jgi:hypothetical protein